MRARTRRRRANAWPFVYASVFVGVAVACGSSGGTCTCSIEENGEHTDVVCGQTACVGGVEFTCNGDQSLSQHVGCAEGTPGPSGTGRAPPPAASSTVDAAPPPPPDQSCSNLLGYCNTSCQNPPDVAASCLATASSNNPSECQSWQSSNAILCQP